MSELHIGVQCWTAGENWAKVQFRVTRAQIQGYIHGLRLHSIVLMIRWCCVEQTFCFPAYKALYSMVIIQRYGIVACYCSSASLINSCDMSVLDGMVVNRWVVEQYQERRIYRSCSRLHVILVWMVLEGGICRRCV